MDESDVQDLISPRTENTFSRATVEGPLRIADRRRAQLNAPEIPTTLEALASNLHISQSGRFFDTINIGAGTIGMPNDPNFTVDRHKELFKEAMKELPDQFIGPLYAARSEQEFMYLKERAKTLQKAYQDVAMVDSTVLQGVMLFTHLVDPAALAVGWGTTIGSLRAIQAAARAGHIKLGMAGNLLTGAAAGAAGGIATEGVYEATGGISDMEAYVMSGLIGAALGAALGPYAAKRPGDWAKVRQSFYDRAKGTYQATGVEKAAQRWKEYLKKSPSPPPVPEVPAAAPRPSGTVMGEAPPQAPTGVRVSVGGAQVDIQVPPEAGQAARRAFGFPGEATPTARAVEGVPPKDMIRKIADTDKDKARPGHLGVYEVGDARYRVTQAEDGTITIQKRGKDRWRKLKDTYSSIEDARKAILLNAGIEPVVADQAVSIGGKATIADTLEALIEGRAPPSQIAQLAKLFSKSQVNRYLKANGMPGIPKGVSAQRALEDYIAMRWSARNVGPDNMAAGQGSSAGAMRPMGFAEGKHLEDFINDEMNDFINWSSKNLPRFRNIFLLRYDRQGLLQNSSNDWVSYIASHLSNNPVGMPDGSAIPISVETISERGRQNYMNRTQSAWLPQFEDWAEARKTPRTQIPEAREEFMTKAGRRQRETDKEGTADNYDPLEVAAADVADSILKDYVKRFKERNFEWAEELGENPAYLQRSWMAPKIHEFVNKGRPVMSVRSADPPQGLEKVIYNGMIEGHNREYIRELEYLKKKGMDEQIITDPDGTQRVFLGMDPDTGEEMFHVVRLSDRRIRLKARAYTSNVYKRAMGLGDDLEHLIIQGDREALYRRIREGLTENDTVRIDEADAMAIADYLMPPKFRGKGFFSDFTHKRAIMDENAKTYFEGEGEIAVKDFLDNNLERVMAKYASRAEGLLALSHMEITNPATGNVMVPGIRSRADFDKYVIKYMREAAGGDPDKLKNWYGNLEDQLNWMYNRIMGIPEKHYRGKYADFVRWTRQIQTMRLMSNVGLAQGGETGMPIGVFGLKAFAKYFKPQPFAVDTKARGAKNPRLISADPYRRQVEAMVGLPPPRLHGGYYNITNIVDGTDMPFTWSNNQQKSLMSGWDKVKYGLHVGEELTYKYSAMRHIQHEQQLFTVNAATEAIIQAAETGDRSLLKRLRSYGIDDRKPQLPEGTVIPPGVEGRIMSMSMLERIAYEMKNNIEYQKHWDEGTMGSLRLDKWEDAQAKFVWEHSMNIVSRRLIQAQSPSQAAAFMDGRTAKLVFMFRSFALTAWANQFLHNLHMADWRTVATAIYTMGIAGMLRVGQVQAQSLTKNKADREEYLDKHMSLGRIGLDAFQRAGWSSIFPMAFDTVGPFVGIEGTFSARSSGQPSALLAGNPFLSWADQLAKGTGGTFKAAFGERELTQTEAKAIINSMVPWGNFFAFQNLTTLLIEDLPKRAPATEQNETIDKIFNERMF